jgi:hypothetical protein
MPLRGVAIGRNALSCMYPIQLPSIESKSRKDSLERNPGPFPQAREHFLHNSHTTYTVKRIYRYYVVKCQIVLDATCASCLHSEFAISISLYFRLQM